MIALGGVVGLGLVIALPDGSEAPGATLTHSSPSAHPTAAAAAAAAVKEATQILRLWDEARARAWATGDQKALEALYVPDSAAAAVDVAMLRRWLDRGLRVTGVERTISSLEVLERSEQKLRLAFLEQTGLAEYVGEGVEGAVADPEMTPGASRPRVVELRETEGTWRMASVIDQ